MPTEPDDRSFPRAMLTVTAGVVILLVGGVTIALFAVREGAKVRGPSSFLVDPPKVEVTPTAPSAGAAPPPDSWSQEVTPATPTGPSAQPRRTEGARQALPRPPAAGPPADGPIDKRPGPHPDSTRLTEELMASMEEMQPDIQDCVQQWADAGEVFDGGLMLAFRLGPDGLQDAEVLDVEDLPAPVMTCFAAAVWEVEWPEVTEPLEVTRRYEVTSDDSG